MSRFTGAIRIRTSTGSSSTYFGQSLVTAPELPVGAPLPSNVPRRLQLTLAASTAMGNGESVGETRFVGDNGFIGRLR